MMAPIVLDLARVPIAVIGRGPLAERRLASLDAEGRAAIRLYSDAPSEALARAAGNRLVRRLPQPADLAGVPVVFIADFDAVQSAALARLARDRGALVNVEDRTALCDFHVPATVRRGDLVLTVSTGGKSPALARRLRHCLAELFPQPWAERLEKLAGLRASLKQHGAPPREIARATEDVLERESWLPGPQPQH
jgi:precorrin-2 dehydrogenase/sirohydrochlorin ferrochelatase